MVIGGGVTGLGHTLLAAIRTQVYRQSLPLATGNLPIVLGELGPTVRRHRRRPAHQRPPVHAVTPRNRAALSSRTRTSHVHVLALFTMHSERDPHEHVARAPCTRRAHHALRSDRPATPASPRGYLHGTRTTALLTMSGITKSFPGVRALDGVDLDVQAGEVHCLLGQNGAGKSTLIKVLAGAHQPDGAITWRGEPVTLVARSPPCALGIATIYQELDLVEGLSVAENIFLGHEPPPLGSSGRGRTTAAARGAAERLGHPEIRPGRRVGALSAAAQQIVSAWPGRCPTTPG